MSSGEKRTGGSSVGVDGFGSQDVCIVGEGAKSGEGRDSIYLLASMFTV